ncbi:HD domain-containing protein [Thermoflexus sp.]|uniref:HD domain-containing protein n=1 Tax=Thermoflexus sp. TaxID=1969742 RepID=UPI0025F2A742|nr:HD domain-containing protein [Thermoflexus sp.]MDW8181152.1 HD domain-containing protein [Anaerolineae bacterium]MCS6963636.1 HD domain-containing protein [Thermoflexus sp.]MCS7351694.1 HD domain-containing protein [Thermoflexus sp.]MCX7689780.1 HD domain-containing protein [Thermoflexus sp.]MDW8186201.1 HD domain-containing protein [Anaerolineae bacterium]
MEIDPEEVRPLYADRDPAHDFEHILRVVRLAERIARSEGADPAVVRAAALLHDVRREEADHAIASAAFARWWLTERGASTEFIEAVAHAIEAHRFREPRVACTLEARVLFDADKLDALGIIGLARLFAYSGAHCHPLWIAVGEEETGMDSAAHEFFRKIRLLPERMQTETGRRWAEARLDRMRRAIEWLEAEIHGEDFEG